MNLSKARVLGIGIDLCDVKRISDLIDKHGDVFLDKVFTGEEIQYCQKFSNSTQKFAARFAAKEAMAKALGTGISGDITLKSLSVRNNDVGKPEAIFDKAVEIRLKEIGGQNILISLTHLKEYAQATAIIV